MSLHGIRAPRSASGPSRPLRSQPRSSTRSSLAPESVAAAPAALEQHVLERRPVEVALAHPAVAEHHALERGMAETGEVDPALVEGDVGERRLREVRSRQSASPLLHPPRREARRALTGPVRRPRRRRPRDRRSRPLVLDRRRGRAGTERSAASVPSANTNPADLPHCPCGSEDLGRRGGSGGDDALRAVRRPRQVRVAPAIQVDEENRRRLALDSSRSVPWSHRPCRSRPRRPAPRARRSCRHQHASCPQRPRPHSTITSVTRRGGPRILSLEPGPRHYARAAASTSSRPRSARRPSPRQSGTNTSRSLVTAVGCKSTAPSGSPR